MVQFVGREAKYRWVILGDRRGVIPIHSLQGQAVLGQSLPLFCPSSNVLASEEHGGGSHSPCLGHFLCISLAGCPGRAWVPCRGSGWEWRWLGLGVLAPEVILPLRTEPGFPPGRLDYALMISPVVIAPGS